MNKVTMPMKELLKSFGLFILSICVTGVLLSFVEQGVERDDRMAHNRKSIRLDA